MSYLVINTYISNNIIDILYYSSILSSILVISNRNAIISIIYLILLYIVVALYLYYVGLGIVGLLYILIYVGAITILFLFILSLMDIKLNELTYTKNQGDYILIVCTVILLFSIVLYTYNIDILSIQYNSIIYYIYTYIIPEVNTGIASTIIPLNTYNIYSILTPNTNTIINTHIELSVISSILYTHYSIVFILLGIVLLYSIVTAISLLYNHQQRV